MHRLIAKNNLLLRSVSTLAKVHSYNVQVGKTCKKLTKFLTDFQETVNVFRELPGVGTQLASILSKNWVRFYRRGRRRYGFQRFGRFRKRCESQIYLFADRSAVGAMASKK